jgi:hypothetical protein
MILNVSINLVWEAGTMAAIVLAFIMVGCTHRMKNHDNLNDESAIAGNFLILLLFSDRKRQRCCQTTFFSPDHRSIL